MVLICPIHEDAMWLVTDEEAARQRWEAHLEEEPDPDHPAMGWTQ
jgi:hypothetical protein